MSEALQGTRSDQVTHQAAQRQNEGQCVDGARLHLRCCDVRLRQGQRRWWVLQGSVGALLFLAPVPVYGAEEQVLRHRIRHLPLIGS
jgi:hypothetical protein